MEAIRFIPPEWINKPEILFVLLIPKSTSKNYFIVEELSRKFQLNEHIKSDENKVDLITVGVRIDNFELELLMSILKLSYGWKGIILLLHGIRIIDYYKLSQAVNCLIDSYKFPTKENWCKRIIDYDPSNLSGMMTLRITFEKPDIKFKDNIRIIIPCKSLYIYPNELLNVEGDEARKDFVMMKAIENNIDWCPFFDIKRFSIGKTTNIIES
jgi:hypothetical protein